MSEEEKKAIRDLIDSNNLSLIGDGTIITSRKIIEIILNLIDKQHKEINRLQEENKALKNQLSYALNTNNKDILKHWRKK